MAKKSAAKAATKAKPDPSGLPIPTGKALHEEVEKWRAIGGEWAEQHDDYTRRQGDEDYGAEDGRKGYAVKDASLKKLNEGDRLRLLVRAVDFLVENPPEDLKAELAEWRRLGKLGIAVVEKLRLGCGDYKERVRDARRLLNMPIPMDLNITLLDVPIMGDWDPGNEETADYEIIVRRKPGRGKKAGEVIFQHSIYDWEQS